MFSHISLGVFLSNISPASYRISLSTWILCIRVCFIIVNLRVLFPLGIHEIESSSFRNRFSLDFNENKHLYCLSENEKCRRYKLNISHANWLTASLAKCYYVFRWMALLFCPSIFSPLLDKKRAPAEGTATSGSGR